MKTMNLRFDLNSILREAGEDEKLDSKKTVQLTQEEITAVVTHRKKAGSIGKHDQSAK
jgi:hypothetical protein